MQSPPPVLVLRLGVLAHRGLAPPLSRGHAGGHSEGKHQAASLSLLLSLSSNAALPPDEHDGGDAVEEDLCGQQNVLGAAVAVHSLTARLIHAFLLTLQPS